MASLLKQIQSVGPVIYCGCRNQLYLLIIFPTAIANKTNVQNEFCGGDHDCQREIKWLNSSSPTERSVNIQVGAGVLGRDRALSLGTSPPPPHTHTHRHCYGVSLSFYIVNLYTMLVASVFRQLCYFDTQIHVETK